MKTEKLSMLGLQESEIKVYTSLLENGPGSAGKVAKETKLNRGTVYNALDKLVDKGLASYTIKANRKEFEASDPAIIKKLIEDREKKLESLKDEIPSLSKLYNSSKKEVVTNVYEGIKGMKAIWEKLLKDMEKGDEWLILGAPEKAEILGGYFKDFNERRAKKGVKMKIIYNKTAKELYKVRKEQRLTKVRVLPEEYITPVSLEVVNDTALVVIYKPKLMTFSIRNKETAESFKSYFDLLWEKAEKV